MDFKSKPIILVSIVIAVIIAAAGFCYWSKSKQAPPEPEEASSLGGQIFDKTQNPLEGQVPDVNPFETVPNPFKKETNPMRAIYTNPFGEQ